MDTLNEIKSIPIKDAFRSLKIRRSGTNYYCFNPAHQDDRPSLSINESKNYFKCFGCGISGDVINLYMSFYNFDFKTAAIKLAKDFNIQFNDFNSSNYNNTLCKVIPEYLKVRNFKRYKFLCKYDEYLFDERAGIYQYEANYNQQKAESLALDYIRKKRLEQNKIIFLEFHNYCRLAFPEGIQDDIMTYLIDIRNLSKEVIYKNKLFSLSNYQDVNNYLLSKFDIEELKGSGLFNNYGQLVFKDSHRLIIPYLENGKIVYMRARRTDGGSDMKYFGLRSDDTGLNTIKRFYNCDILTRLKQNDRLFICEGEMDCLTLESFGLNAIAIPGVNSILDDLTNLKNYNIILCFDNDQTGKKATDIFIRKCKNADINVNIIELPIGIKDVSEFFVNELQ